MEEAIIDGLVKGSILIIAGRVGVDLSDDVSKVLEGFGNDFESDSRF